MAVKGIIMRGASWSGGLIRQENKSHGAKVRGIESAHLQFFTGRVELSEEENKIARRIAHLARARAKPSQPAKKSLHIRVEQTGLHTHVEETGLLEKERWSQ